MLLLGDITANQDDNLLYFNDFCRLFVLIKKHVDPRLQKRLFDLKEERRKLLDQY
jgi:hypothetical protein